MLHALCFAAFLTTQTADTVSSARLLRLPAIYAEANPLMPSSVGGLVAVKSAVIGSVSTVAWSVRKTHPKWAIALFAIGAVSGGIGAWHNTHLR